MSKKHEAFLGMFSDLMEETVVVPCGGCEKGELELSILNALLPQTVAISIPSLIKQVKSSVRRLEHAHGVIALSCCPEDCASKLLTPFRAPDVDIRTSDYLNSEDLIAKLKSEMDSLCSVEFSEVLPMEEIELDCRGLRCPMPIIRLSSVSRELGRGQIDIYADDPSFPSDLEAWCKQRSAALAWLPSDEKGTFRAIVSFEFKEIETLLEREPSSEAKVEEADKLPVLERIDSMGVRSPLQIVALQKALLCHSQPGLLVLKTDDPAFAQDVKNWCVEREATLVRLTYEGKVLTAWIAVNAKEKAPVFGSSELKNVTSDRMLHLSSRPEPSLSLPVQSSVKLDYKGLRCPMPIVRLGQEVAKSPGETFSIDSDDPAFLSDLRAWCEHQNYFILSSRTIDGALRVVIAPDSKPLNQSSPYADNFSNAFPPPVKGLDRSSSGKSLERTLNSWKIPDNRETRATSVQGILSEIHEDANEILSRFGHTSKEDEPESVSLEYPSLAPNEDFENAWSSLTGSLPSFSEDLTTTFPSELQVGFEETSLPNSSSFLEDFTKESPEQERFGHSNALSGFLVTKNREVLKLDYRGLKCPMPIVRLTVAWQKHRKDGGEEMEVQADDPAFYADVKAWCEVHGFDIIKHNKLQRTETVKLRQQ